MRHLPLVADFLSLILGISGMVTQRAFASLIFIGMAAIEITFPLLIRPAPVAGKRLSARFPAILAAPVTAARHHTLVRKLDGGYHDI